MKYHTRRELSNINVFVSLDNHNFENYVLSLAIADFYFDTRLLNYGKFYNEIAAKKGTTDLRQQYNKMILFKGIVKNDFQ